MRHTRCLFKQRGTFLGFRPFKPASQSRFLMVLVETWTSDGNSFWICLRGQAIKKYGGQRQNHEDQVGMKNDYIFEEKREWIYYWKKIGVALFPEVEHCNYWINDCKLRRVFDTNPLLLLIKVVFYFYVVSCKFLFSICRKI